MNALEPELQPQQDAAPVTTSTEPEQAPTGTVPDASTVLQMAGDAQQPAAPSASEQAFGAPTTKPKPQKRHHNSHDGGFTGFGAEYNPYSYTDPKMNHGKLDPKVKKLGAQHVRIFVPLGAIQTSLLGKVGPDFHEQNIEHLTNAVANNPGDAKLQKQLHNAQEQHKQDVSYVNSFLKTIALAGKHATINLTFCGAVGQDNHTDVLAQIVAYLVGQGYENLNVTLENEPNGPDKGDGFRGRFNKATNKHDRKHADEAAHEYVDAYKRLDEDLKKLEVRQNVGVVGGDMVGNHRKEFFETITREGLSKFVDAYSFHIYWGGGQGHSYGETLQRLNEIQALGKKYAPGKPLEITEFGKERPATTQERAHDPSHKGVHAVEQGTNAAFEQGLFALSAVNVGFTGLVKWDAFSGGEHHKGDGKGDYGEFSMIRGPKTGYATDATYRLLRMFTHATEAGWHVHGTNHGVQGAEAHFKSADGHDGAVLAMSERGGSVSTAGLPHKKLYVTVWNGSGKGDLHTHVLEHGSHSVHIPANGAVAVSTKPL